MSPRPATALGRFIHDLILLEGPIGVDRYMALALGHPALGYYMTRNPLGRSGDFITAPEISQMFGEMIGLWAAEVWSRMGSPALLRLVELGPGRGTLMADILRVSRLVPAFRNAIQLHLVETSPVLRDAQADLLGHAGITAQWHDGLDDVPPGPAIVLANEFFDALPVRHYQKTPKGWCERLVGLNKDGALSFGLAPEPEPRLTLAGPESAIVEIGAAAQIIVGRLAARLRAQGGAALIFDYGHTQSGFGETLQALRGHAYADALTDPGEADLTAHVDFAALARTAAQAGAVAHGPVGQGAFLLGLGMEARAERLVAAQPHQADAIRGALHRLTASEPDNRQAMGSLFKVLA